MKDNSREQRRSRLMRRQAFGEIDTADIDTSAPVVKQENGKSRLWLFLLVCLIGSTGASFVVFKYLAPSVIAPSIPSELVGTWEVVDGELKGATLEFTWHGTAIATSYKGKAREVTTSSVKLEGKRVFLATEDPRTRKTETVVQTIINLTDNELVIRDEDRIVYRMVRVNP